MRRQIVIQIDGIRSNGDAIVMNPLKTEFICQLCEAFHCDVFAVHIVALAFDRFLFDLRHFPPFICNGC